MRTPRQGPTLRDSAEDSELVMVTCIDCGTLGMLMREQVGEDASACCPDCTEKRIAAGDSPTFRAPAVRPARRSGGLRL